MTLVDLILLQKCFLGNCLQYWNNLTIFSHGFLLANQGNLLKRMHRLKNVQAKNYQNIASKKAIFFVVLDVSQSVNNLFFSPQKTVGPDLHAEGDHDGRLRNHCHSSRRSRYRRLHQQKVNNFKSKCAKVESTKVEIQFVWSFHFGGGGVVWENLFLLKLRGRDGSNSAWNNCNLFPIWSYYWLKNLKRNNRLCNTWTAI